jgi:hypothetical protein
MDDDKTIVESLSDQNGFRKVVYLLLLLVEDEQALAPYQVNWTSGWCWYLSGEGCLLEPLLPGCLHFALYPTGFQTGAPDQH